MLFRSNGANAPTVLETWEMYGCLVSAVDYQTVNYANNEVVTIQMTIKYDNAVQTPMGSGVGAAVTRTLGTVVTG